MDPYGRDTVAEIHLDAMLHNIRVLRQSLPKNGAMMAIIKADAYGHGALMTARTLLDAGVQRLGVAIVDEAHELRANGIFVPIHVLGIIPVRALPYAIQARLVLTVASLDNLQSLEEAARTAEQPLEVHVKVDTGVGRLGFSPTEAPFIIQRCQQHPWLRLTGISTHFATADEPDPTYLRQQVRSFTKILRMLREGGVELPWIHSSNTAGTLQATEVPFRQFVRVGLGLYGVFPTHRLRLQEQLPLRPVLNLRSRITTLRQLPPGTSVGYGCAYVARGDEWIATVPVGYADGIRRDMAARGGCVLVQGQRVPIVGNVCMDQFMIDVSSLQTVSVGDEVVIYGQQGEETIHVSEVAERLQTIPYELLCAVSRRVPREYVQGGQVVNCINYLRALPPGTRRG